MIGRRRFPVIAIAVLAGLFLGSVRAETIRLQIDTQKTQIKASVEEPLSKLRDTGTADATFQVISGEIDGDPANVAATGHVKFVIDATTYSSGSDHRDRKVLSSSLETAQYPSITFESTRIENVEVEAPGAIGKAVVVGDLTLHGTTRQISVPVSVSMSPDGIFTADGSITFNYTDYGVKVPRFLFAIPASNEVTVSFRVIAARVGSLIQPQAMR